MVVTGVGVCNSGSNRTVVLHQQFKGFKATSEGEGNGTDISTRNTYIQGAHAPLLSCNGITVTRKMLFSY